MTLWLTNIDLGAFLFVASVREWAICQGAQWTEKGCNLNFHRLRAYFLQPISRGNYFVGEDLGVYSFSFRLTRLY